ncbi:sugar phosphate isomerase/epimerase [Novosphingobium sp. PhB165]|uniref:sugar phosphate isomerase/epimerase family protein n=1 Tax=Novosphingobium sp. PhB165 TaxID=2485105 RepID=UPI0010E4EF52|nr:TIM barrel protein [Novosphingobium sp. PhB165]TCM14650.1 sugar phosphate isomerase/epimerase [Novosphingobium sp. PhB165]
MDSIRSHRLSLDHITAVDATPRLLAETAAQAGCSGICLFMEPMAVLPTMPPFDLLHDPHARRELARCLADLGIAFDLAYPFTLTGRTDPASFAAALETAAELGADLVNVLAYDRDPARRLDIFGRFCDRAAEFDLRVAVEFYPPSQIGSLAAALELVGAIKRPGRVGVNVDILHLIRSRGTLAELKAAPAGSILYGQLCDGMLAAPEDIEHEASRARLLAGEGQFDLAGFVAALPPQTPISVEIPRDHALALPRERRVAEALDSVRAALGWN